jgi:hypothetical protein
MPQTPTVRAESHTHETNRPANYSLNTYYLALQVSASHHPNGVAWNRDTTVLCESLTYNQGLPEVLAGEEVQEYITLYSPPFQEFEVFRVSLPAGASTLVPANQVI